MNKNWKQRLALASAFTLIAVSQASAAVPAAYTDAIDDAVTDVTSIMTTVGAALAGLAVIAVLARVVVKKIKGASSAV